LIRSILVGDHPLIRKKENLLKSRLRYSLSRIQ
jgi:hypothetical protein